jgi:DNA-binding NtrC family response regulator
VRELRNVIERAVILCEGGMITSEHLRLDVADRNEPSGIAAAAGASPNGATPATLSTLDAAERDLIVAALARSGNDKSKAARLLGLTRAQLRSRIQKHGIAAEG